MKGLVKMNTKIDQKDLNKVSRDWLIGSQISWNYERMMGGGYLCAMLPVHLLVRSLRCAEQLVKEVRYIRTRILDAIDGSGIPPSLDVEPTTTFHPQLV